MRPQGCQYYKGAKGTREEFEQIYDEPFTTQYGFFHAYVKQVTCARDSIVERNVG
jgi:hypothetical protein